MLSFLSRFFVLMLFITIIASWYFIPDSFFVEYSNASEGYVMKKTEEESEKLKKNIKKTEVDYSKSKIKHSVPFMVQAPHAQWDDLKYQDACEEASMLMAGSWVNDDGHISKNKAEEEIEKIFELEEEMFGDVIDTSATDTAALFQKYYGHSAEVKKDVSLQDIQNFLSDGYIVIAPTNGKWLNNPHFTNGGPERHMLIVVGFDKKNGEFITNDPGTKVGRGYKYKDSTFFNSIRDYNTGNKNEITSSGKNVIIIKK